MTSYLELVSPPNEEHHLAFLRQTFAAASGKVLLISGSLIVAEGNIYRISRDVQVTIESGQPTGQSQSASFELENLNCRIYGVTSD